MRLSASRPFCRGFHADLVMVTSTAGTGDQRKPKTDVKDCGDCVDSSLLSLLSPRKERWLICKPHLHRPQHLWNKRAGAERVWVWLDHGASVLFHFCAGLQRFRGWRFFFFLFHFNKIFSLLDFCEISKIAIILSPSLKCWVDPGVRGLLVCHGDESAGCYGDWEIWSVAEEFSVKSANRESAD